MAIQWPLVLFTAITGMAGWLLVPLAIDEVKGRNANVRFLAAICALVLEIVGGLASMLHLSHPDRVLGAFGHPTSGIFTEAALLFATAICIFVYLLLVRREASAGVRKAFAVIAAALGVVLSFMAGASYMMPAQLAWNTPLLPLAYLGTAIPTGIALYLCLLLAKKDDSTEWKLHALLLAAGGVVAAIAAALYAVASGSASVDPLVIWGLAVVVGGIGSAALGFVARKQDSPLGLAVAALVVALVGSVAFRAFMWISMNNVDNFFHML